MIKRKIILGFLFCLLIIQIGSFLPQQFINHRLFPAVFASAQTIGTVATTGSTATKFAFGSLIVNSPSGICFAFWTNTTNAMFYASSKTSSCTTWNSASYISETNGSTSAGTTAFFPNGTKIYYVHASGQGAAEFILGYMTISGSTVSVTKDDKQTAVTGSAALSGSLTLDTAGNEWIAIEYNSGANKVWKCAAGSLVSCSASLSNTDNCFPQIFKNGSNVGEACVNPAGNTGKMEFYGYTGSTWSAAKLSSSDGFTSTRNEFNCISISTTQYCSVYAGTPNACEYIVYSDGTYSTQKQKGTGTFCSIATDYKNDLFFAYNSTDTELDYNYTTNLGTSWSSKQVLASGETSPEWLAPDFNATSSIASFEWQAGSATPYNIRFAQTAALTITETLKGILKTGGSTEKATLAGGANPSPTNANFSSGAGSSNSITANPSATLSVNVVSDTSTLRYRFNSSSTTRSQENFTTGSSAETHTLSNWEQLPFSNPAALSLTISYTGVANTTSDNTGWADYGTASFNVSGILQGSYNLTGQSWIYQETSLGFQILSNTSISSLSYDSTSGVLSYSVSATSHDKIHFPGGYTSNGCGGTKSKASGQYLDVNSTAGQIACSWITPTSNGGVGNGGTGIGGSTQSTSILTTTNSNGSTITTTITFNSTTTSSIPNVTCPCPAIPTGATISHNWAGYVVNTSGSQQVTDVIGSFIVPQTLCGLSASFIGYWVGIDGFSSNTVEQAGVLSYCQAATARYISFYEFYPFPMQVGNVSVSPGDKIRVEVSYLNSIFIVSLNDQTNNQKFAQLATSPAAALNSGEWIVEDPSGANGILPIAYFHQAFFGPNYTGIAMTDQLALNSGPLYPLQFYPSYAITMEPIAGQVLANASALLSNVSFFVTEYVSPPNLYLNFFPWLILIVVFVFAIIGLERKKRNVQKLIFTRKQHNSHKSIFESSKGKNKRKF